MIIEKFLYMLTKDTKIFLRDIRSFILLFLTPILIVMLVGVAFLSTQPTHVPVIICSDSKTTDLYRDTSLLLRNSGIFDVSEEEGNCRKIISQRIKNSEVRAGVIVPRESTNATIEILIDNTKPVSTYIESYFNLITKDLSQKLINAMISDMWSNIDVVLAQIDSVRSELDAHSRKLNQISNDLETSSLAVTTIKNKIAAIKNVQKNFEIIDGTLGFLQNDIVSISSNLNSLDTTITGINNTLTTLNISYMERLMLYGSVASMRTAVADMKKSVGSAQNYVTYARTVTSDSRKILDDANLNDMENRLADVANTLSTASASVMSVKNSMDALSNRLMIAKNVILSSSQKYKPIYSDPVNSKISRYFGNKRYIDFVFPTILVMILMLMSTFLSSTSYIRQRSTGLLKRISISTTGSNFLLLERTIFNAFISLIPLPFILAAGALALGIQINIYNAVPIIFVCAILSVVFVLIGLIIASFSRTESTAILASLIFVVPMMFLSGAFTPFEAFPPALQAVATSMPITVSARLIEGLTFYQLSPEMMATLVAVLFVYIVVAALIARILMKRGN